MPAATSPKPTNNVVNRDQLADVIQRGLAIHNRLRVLFAPLAHYGKWSPVLPAFDYATVYRVPVTRQRGGGKRAKPVFATAHTGLAHLGGFESRRTLYRTHVTSQRGRQKGKKPPTSKLPAPENGFQFRPQTNFRPAGHPTLKLKGNCVQTTPKPPPNCPAPWG